VAHARGDIVRRWAVLSSVQDPNEWEAAIADAELQVSADAWGSLYDLGVIHLAAHLLSVNHPEFVGAGTVQSESVGPLSRTYAVATPSRNVIASTPAGKEYLRVRGSLGLGFSVV